MDRRARVHGAAESDTTEHAGTHLTAVLCIPLSQDLPLKSMVLPVLLTESKIAREFAGETPK